MLELTGGFSRRRGAGLVFLRRFLLGLLLTVVAVGAAEAANPPLMVTPGQFSVSSTGAATYSIPIMVPPGTSGVVPSLSLAYSSQNGDGYVGLGWGLTGLPSISRCPRTLAQDSTHGSVNYDSNDRFCLDGQRMMLISGTYGADGSQYRTEIESFSKIIAHGSSGSGPSWFEVHTKAGQIMEFGNSVDSAVLVVSAGTSTITTGTIRAWEVNKISDVVGNYMTVTYNCTPSGGVCTDTSRTTYGQAYPLEIDYSGHTSSPTLSPYNSVRFSYCSRDGTPVCSRGDSVPMYQAGGLVQPTVLLWDIKTYQGANLVQDYQLDYRRGTSVLRSHLTSVTQCDNASNCLPSTTFGWQGGGSALSMTGTTNTISAGKALLPLVDTTGITNAAIIDPASCSDFPIYLGPNFTTASSSTIYNYGVGNATCANSAVPIQLAPNGASNYQLTTNAVGSSGDHEGSIILFGPSTYRLFTTTGQFMPPAIPGDYNGDGLPDVTLLYGPTTSEVWVTNGTSSYSPLSAGYISSIYPGGVAPSVGDFDGDGCSDFYVYSSTQTVYYNCAPAAASTTVGPTSTNLKYFGDFNGDGKTDTLVLGTSGNSQLWLSTGTGFVATNTSLPVGWANSYRVVIGDWNGDGKADILLVSIVSGTSHELYLSTGTDFTAALDGSNNPITIANSGSTICATANPSDWNSDGATDFWMQYCSLSGLSDTIYTFSYVPELMTSVSNGVGATTSISYDRINQNGSFYTPGSGATYPAEDVNGPIYVVKEEDASNGLGTCNPASSYTNCYRTTYTYAGAQKDLKGRGFLGFATVTATDLQTSIVTTTNYSTAFPYIGLIISETKVHSSVTLSSATNTYANNAGCSVTPAASGVVIDCLMETVVSGHDLNGATLPTTTTDYTYDSYGNALTTNVSVTDGSSKDTTNTYSNDTTNWFLGRLLTTSVHSIVGSSNMTRQSSFSYDSSTGLLTQEVIEPGVSTCNSGSSSCTLTTNYTYDAFGHRVATQVSGTGITARTSQAFYDSNGEFMTSAGLMDILYQVDRDIIA